MLNVLYTPVIRMVNNEIWHIFCEKIVHPKCFLSRNYLWISCEIFSSTNQENIAATVQITAEMYANYGGNVKLASNHMDIKFKYR